MRHCGADARHAGGTAIVPLASPSPWRRTRLAEDLGPCTTDLLDFGDGLALVYAHYQPLRTLTEASHVRRPPALTLTIALEGRSRTLDGDGQRFDFIAGHSTLAAFASVRGQRCFPAQQPVRQLRVVAEEPLLRRYGLAGLLDGVADGRPARQLHSGPHSAATRQLADTVVHLHARGGSLLDLQIAALGLLADRTRAFLPQAAPPQRLPGADQDRLLRARELMLQQYDRPLTVAYLCAEVGTNAFKLKQGFRALFGTSPHRLLTRIRMEKAWELLESGLHVSTVAYRVGYQHLSSFSAAFARHHGRTPKSVAGPRGRRP